MITFNEANSVRDLVGDHAVTGGWDFIPGADLDRDETEVLIVSDLRDALIRLNPTIAAKPDRADEILFALAMTTGGRPHSRMGGLTQDQIARRDGLR